MIQKTNNVCLVGAPSGNNAPYSSKTCWRRRRCLSTQADCLTISTRAVSKKGTFSHKLAETKAAMVSGHTASATSTFAKKSASQFLAKACEAARSKEHPCVEGNCCQATSGTTVKILQFCSGCPVRCQCCKKHSASLAFWRPMPTTFVARKKNKDLNSWALMRTVSSGPQVLKAR